MRARDVDCRAEAAPAAGRSDDEGGFTLIELLVAMAIFSIVMVMVSDTMGWIGGAQSHVEAMAATSGQVDTAFATLDSEVRYAADINEPGVSGDGSYWVELESDWTAASSGAPQCTQIRYTPQGVLEQRTWSLGASVPPLATAQWQVLASGLSTSSQSDPFTLTHNTAGTPWQLAFAMAASGTGTAAPTSELSFTLTALNVAQSSSYQNICGGNPP